MSSLPDGTLYAHMSAMQPDQLGYERQPDAGSFMRPGLCAPLMR